MMYDVFISYSSIDKEIATKICRKLESSGINCWIAPRNILPGKPWAEAIVEAIKNCNVMVFIYSLSSNNSIYSIREVAMAASKRKTIVTFKVGDTPISDELEFYIGHLHWLDAMKPPIDMHIDSLVADVQAFVNSVADESGEPAVKSLVLSDNVITPDTGIDLLLEEQIAEKSPESSSPEADVTDLSMPKVLPATSMTGTAATNAKVLALKALIDRLSKITQNSAIKSSLIDLGERTLSRDVKIIVMGNYRCGKSTLVNAFFKETLVPSISVVSWTPQFEIKKGDSKNASIWFNGLPSKKVFDCLPMGLQKYLNTAKGEPAPLDVPVNLLNGYAVLPMTTDEDMTTEVMKFFKKVELFVPAMPFAGVSDIVDYPGDISNVKKNNLLLNTIAQADIVIYTLSCQSLVGLTDIGALKAIIGLGHEKVMIVCNRFDMIPPEEKDLVRCFMVKKLKEFTSFGEQGIFFLSAQQAMDSRLSGDTALESASGIVELERAIVDFISKDIGRTKFFSVASMLKNRLNETRSFAMTNAAIYSGDNYLRVSAELDSIETDLIELVNSWKEK